MRYVIFRSISRTLLLMACAIAQIHLASLRLDAQEKPQADADESREQATEDDQKPKAPPLPEPVGAGVSNGGL